VLILSDALSVLRRKAGACFRRMAEVSYSVRFGPSEAQMDARLV
jgi:hypothetical protein